MKSLLQYIVENIQPIFEASKEQIEYAKLNPGIHAIGGKNGWFATADDFIEWLFNKDLVYDKRTKMATRSKVLKNMFNISSEDDEKDIKTAIQNCYNICKSKGNSPKYNTVPFVIYTDGTNQFSIRTDINLALGNQIMDIMNNLSCANKDKFKDTHTGFSTRAVKGLAAEELLSGALENFIFDFYPNFYPIFSMVGLDIFSEDEKLIKPFAEDYNMSIELFKCCQKICKLSDIFNKYINLNDKNTTITVTGGGNTHRSQKDKIINYESFSIIDGEDFEKMLKDSGQIIADITITFPDTEELYISCKIDEAQLSGIANNYVFYKNGLRKTENEIFNPNNYDDNQLFNLENRDFNAFKGFCNIFGFDENKLFNYYVQTNNKENSKRSKIQISNDYIKDEGDIISLKRLLISLIGSNHIYANITHSDSVVKLDLSSECLNSFDMKLLGGGISESGKTIVRNVQIGSQSNCQFVFRTSAYSHNYPCRLFIKNFSIQQFLNDIKNNI